MSTKKMTCIDDRKSISIFYATISITYAVQFVGVSLKLHNIGASGIVIGISYLLFNFAAMIGSVLISRLLSKYYSTMTIVSVILIAISCYIIYRSTSALMITLGFVLTGFFYSTLGPALTYLLTEENESMKVAVKILTIPQNLGWSIGFLMGALSCMFINLNTAILISASASIISLIFMKPIVSKLREINIKARKDNAKISIEGLKRLVILPYYTSVFLTFLAASTFFTSLPPLLDTLGLKIYEIYFARFIGSVVAVLSYIFTISAMLEKVHIVFHKISQYLFIRGLGFLLLLTAFYLHGFLLFIDASIILMIIGLTWSYLNTGLKVIVLNFGEEAHKIYGDTVFLTCLGFIIGSFIGGALLDISMILVPVISSILAFTAAASYIIASRRAILADVSTYRQEMRTI